MVFLADVALGKPFIAAEPMPSFTSAPKGYDSVWGKARHTGTWGSTLQFDEHIIYSNTQQTVRYIVTFER